LALGGHRLTVTHADGYPVHPVTGDALLLAMGERYDAIVRVQDGVDVSLHREGGCTARSVM
jgi:FtsP/CotA-like multicopper oxidase with cupredoxin domain